MLEARGRCSFCFSTFLSFAHCTEYQSFSSNNSFSHSLFLFLLPLFFPLCLLICTEYYTSLKLGRRCKSLRERGRCKRSILTPGPIPICIVSFGCDFYSILTGSEVRGHNDPSVHTTESVDSWHLCWESKSKLVKGLLSFWQMPVIGCHTNWQIPNKRKQMCISTSWLVLWMAYRNHWT